jgi:hypothetical protein
MASGYGEAETVATAGGYVSPVREFIGSIFDQPLNTFNDVAFESVVVAGALTAAGGVDTPSVVNSAGALFLDGATIDNGVVDATSYTLDPNFKIDFQGLNPRITMDGNDTIVYDRAANELQIKVSPLVDVIHRDGETEFKGQILVDTILEKTGSAGTTINGVVINDGEIWSATDSVKCLGLETQRWKRVFVQNAPGDCNVWIGSINPPTWTTGVDNVVIGGQGAGQSMTTAIHCTFIGSNCGVSTTSAQYCMGLGTSALANNTTGSGNVAMGRDAGRLNVISGSNTSMGNQANRNTTTAENTAVGAFTNDISTTNTTMTCIGYAANPSAATGIVNAVALGNRTLVQNSHDVQLGNRVDNGSGELSFHTQIVSKETWIGNGTTQASIDNGGHLARPVFNTGDGLDAGLTIPDGTLFYTIEPDLETVPFPLTAPAGVAAQILHVRNNSAQATITGLVVAAAGGAIFAHDGTNWHMTSKT